VPGIARIAVSGRPEDTCDQRPEPGKAGIGSFGWEMLLGGERGYKCAAATAEERPDHFGGLRTDTASKVFGSEPGGESYLQASPYVCYVGVLGPDCGREALQHQCAYLIGKWFSRARLVYAGTRTSMKASARGESSLSFIVTGISDSPRAKRLPATCV